MLRKRKLYATQACVNVVHY